MDSTFEQMRLYALNNGLPYTTKFLENGNKVLVIISTDNHVCYVEWNTRAEIVGCGHMSLLEGRYVYVRPIF